MSRQTHFERLSGDVLTSIQNGASVADAASKAGVGDSTVNGWLRRGRDDAKSKYGAFAADVDAAIRNRKLPPEDDRPADRGELLLLTSRAARAGNVQAMRLLSELLDPDHGEDGDSLSRFER